MKSSERNPIEYLFNGPRNGGARGGSADSATDNLTTMCATVQQPLNVPESQL